MDEKQETIKNIVWNGDMTAVYLAIMIVILALGYMVYVEIARGNTIITVAVTAVVFFTLGYLVASKSYEAAHRHQRAAVESMFQLNAVENQALMQQQLKTATESARVMAALQMTQNRQNAMLLKNQNEAEVAGEWLEVEDEEALF